MNPQAKKLSLGHHQQNYNQKMMFLRKETTQAGRKMTRQRSRKRWTKLRCPLYQIRHRLHKNLYLKYQTHFLLGHNRLTLYFSKSFNPQFLGIS